MANNGAVKEEMMTAQKSMPLDLMVATFADKRAAKDAYSALKMMDREGKIDMGSAFVLDRTESGMIRPVGMKLPGWAMWAMVGAGVLMAGLVGAVVWLGILAARGYQATKMEEGEDTGRTGDTDYATSGYESRRYEREGVRMGME